MVPFHKAEILAFLQRTWCLSTLHNMLSYQLKCDAVTMYSISLSHCLQLLFFSDNYLDYKWEYAEWSTCSASCGNSGTCSRSPQCVNSEKQKVNESLCRHLQKPGIIYQSCNIDDCPAR